MQWIKLYYHWSSDELLRDMPDDEFRVWFNLQIHAGKEAAKRGGARLGAFEDDGNLHRKVAAGDRELLMRAIERLIDFKYLVREEEIGWYSLTYFAGEQQRSPSDSRERVRQRVRDHRARKKAAAEIATAGGESVTPLHPVTAETAGNGNGGNVTGRYRNVTRNDLKRVTADLPSRGAGKQGTPVTACNDNRRRIRREVKEEAEEAARARVTDRNGVTERDGRTPAEAALVDVLTAIEGFPPDEGAGTTRLAREYLAAFPDVDVLAVARDYAAADLHHPPAWPRFRGFLKQERERVAAAAERATAPRAVGINGHRPSREALRVAALDEFRPEDA